MTFLQFTNELQGFTFHDKKTGEQIFRWQMFWSKLNPDQCFKKYNTKIIPN